VDECKPLQHGIHDFVFLNGSPDLYDLAWPNAASPSPAIILTAHP
jgi:hypothetical protein